MVGEPRTTDDAIEALRRSGVAVGQRWVGPRGGTYRVVAVCVTRPGCEPMVGCEGPCGVTLPYYLAMFMGRAKRGNVLVPRFTLCEE